MPRRTCSALPGAACSASVRPEPLGGRYLCPWWPLFSWSLLAQPRAAQLRSPGLRWRGLITASWERPRRRRSRCQCRWRGQGRGSCRARRWGSVVALPEPGGPDRMPRAYFSVLPVTFGTSGARANAAVTESAEVIVTVQLPVPVQDRPRPPVRLRRSRRLVDGRGAQLRPATGRRRRTVRLSAGRAAPNHAERLARDRSLALTREKRERRRGRALWEIDAASQRRDGHVAKKATGRGHATDTQA
jgi:hypothetical protein